VKTLSQIRTLLYFSPEQVIKRRPNWGGESQWWSGSRGRGSTCRFRGVEIGEGGRVMRIDVLQSSSKGRANLLASPQGVVKGFGGQTASRGMGRWKSRCVEERSQGRG
jgi:hypothetical protein